MRRQKSGSRRRSLLEGTISLIAGVLVGIGFVFLISSFGISFPSVNQFTSQLWSAIHEWISVASIESPRSYALNTIALVTIVSAVLKSLNRDSPSATISGILIAPGIRVWSRLFTSLLDVPFVGSLVGSIGAAMRFYLWVGTILLYLVYPVLYVVNSDASLFVVTISVLLASVTFGAAFGRFEKGLALSIKSTSETLRKEDYRKRSKLKEFLWALMIPASFISAYYATVLTISSLENPSSGELFSSSTSIFLTTFFAVIGIFYFIAVLVVFVTSCYSTVSSYKNGDWKLREKVRAGYEAYIEEEFSKTENDMSGYPDEVIEALRDDEKG